MAITKEIVDDKLEVVGNYKHIQVRTATVIKKMAKNYLDLTIGVYFRLTMMLVVKVVKLEILLVHYGPIQLKLLGQRNKQRMQRKNKTE